MSRSLSSIIREYEQLKGGRLPEVRRWHNFLLRGGKEFETEEGSQKCFKVDGQFLLGLKYTSLKDLHGFFRHFFGTDIYTDVLEKLNIEILRQPFTRDFMDNTLIRSGILRPVQTNGTTELQLYDITNLLISWKNIWEWAKTTIKSDMAFAFQKYAIFSQAEIDNEENFRSVMTYFPKHEIIKTELYPFLLKRIGQICDHSERRSIHTKLIKEHTDTFRDNVGNYKEIVIQTISNVTDEGLKKQLRFLVHAFNTLEERVEDIVAYNPEEEGGARKRTKMQPSDVVDLT